jgi:iron complex outermembrane receptor protein
VAQPDSLRVYTLDSVLVRSDHTPPDAPPGTRLEVLTPATLNAWRTRSLAEVLQAESQVSIRSYGATGVAVPMFRGTAAGHTAILWNGLKLNSPMLGQTDLSLFPLAFTDDIRIAYGTGSLAELSGALGGSLHLTHRSVHSADGDRPVWATEARVSAGSFGRYYGGLRLSRATARQSHQVRVYGLTAANDFPFVNYTTAGNPRQRNAPAHQLQLGALTLHDYQTRHGLVQAALWYGHSYRALPPPMTVNRNDEHLTDRTLRLSVRYGHGWHVGPHHLTLELPTGFVVDDVRYENRLIRLDSRSQTSGLQVHPTLRMVFAGGRWRAGVGNQLFWERARTTNFYQTVDRVQVEPFAQVGFVHGNWASEVRVRVPVVTGSAPTGVGMLGTEWKPRLGKGIEGLVYGSFGRNARYPTLNDRFWQPGGNPDLLPETAWQAEAGIGAGSPAHHPAHWRLDLTAYQQWIAQWILWQPTVGGFWRPENRQSVRSRGLEGRVYWSRAHSPRGRVWLRAALHLAQTTSTTPGDLNRGLQLIYHPQLSGQGQAGASYRSCSLTVDVQHVGLRYTASDHSAFLAPYTLVHARAEYSRVVGTAGRHRLSAGLQAQNLLNTAYEAIPFRPMPSFAVECTVSYSFL